MVEVVSTLLLYLWTIRIVLFPWNKTILGVAMFRTSHEVVNPFNQLKFLRYQEFVELWLIFIEIISASFMGRRGKSVGAWMGF